MSDVMPDARRNVRCHIDTVGMLTKGNKGKADLNGAWRSLPHSCRACGKPVQGVDTRHYRRGVWCSACQSERSAGEVSGTDRTDTERIAEYVSVMRDMRPERIAAYVNRIPKKYRTAVVRAAS